MSRASQRNALLIQHCYSPYRTTQFEKTIKKRQKGPVLVIKGPFGDLGGPWRAPVDQIWSQLPPIGLPGLDSWSPPTLTWYWVPSGPPGAQKRPILAQISMAPYLLWYCMVLHIPHICHGHHGQCPWRKIGHVEKFQISTHDRCEEILNLLCFVARSVLSQCMPL